MRVTSIFLLAALAGCSSAQDGESQQSITRTIVHLNGDQEPVVTTDVITVEEQQREVAVRLARLTGTPSADRPNAGGIGEAQQGITQDSGCASADVSLFDATGFSGHEICFYGAGTVNLGNYQRCISYPIHVCAPWSGAVRSFYSDYTYSGRFVDPDGSYYLFFPPDSESSVNSNVANAQYLTIFN